MCLFRTGVFSSALTFTFLFAFSPQFALASTKTVILNVGSQGVVQTWTVPSDFQSLVSVEAIGGGGSGANSSSANAGGAGGGAYSKITSLSLTPGQTVSYQVGWAGTWNYNTNAAGYSGGDTFFNGASCSGATLCAKGGGGGLIGGGGAAGSAASSIGSVKYSGGTGSLASTGGGGGGAAGLHGNGNNASGTSGGAGDAGFGGIGGVVNAGSGAGSTGSEYGTGYGSGGGASSGAQGAGGGGGGGSQVLDQGAGPYGSGGGIGGNGLIVITYNTACVSTTGDHSATYTVAGSACAFSVPTYGTLTVRLWGAGGSGSGGNAGTASLFNNTTVSAGGGAAGNAFRTGGSGGTASGGTVNTNGSVGGTAASFTSAGGNGGSAPNGGAGGAGTTGTPSVGSAPGGGGGGGRGGGGGGSGSYVSKTYSSGSLTVGSSIPITVGAGGTTSSNASGGADGQVVVTWTDPMSCTSTVTPSVIDYGSSSTLTWSSAGASTMYITNVGYVTPNVSGSTTVAPSASADYSCTVTDSLGNTLQPAVTILRVTQPNNPTTSITASSTSIYVGQSTGIKATFAAASNDTLTHDNIDSPVGTGLGATSNPDATKYYTFTPSSAGTYTFYARATTQYYTTWTTYNSVTVTVTSPPACTPSVSYTCSGSNIVQTATSSSCVVTTNASYATCVSPAFCSTGSSSCLYSPPSYNQSGSLSGHLQATPLVVPQNTPSKLFWNISNVSSCSISGSNGDSWSTASSGSSGKVTSAIQQQTTYTLACIGLDGTPVHESVSINVVPVFIER